MFTNPNTKKRQHFGLKVLPFVKLNECVILYSNHIYTFGSHPFS